MQAASSLNQSHVQLHAYISLKVHYKAVKTLAVRWADTRLYTNAHFHRDYYYKLRKLHGRPPGNDDEVSTFNLTVFKIFYWTVGNV